MWDPERSHECVALRDVVLQLRVGVYEPERAGPQPVRVDVELYRHRAGGPVRGLEDCLDYDRVFRHIVEEMPKRPHADLLEQLAEDLVGFCLMDERVEACRVIMRKPIAFLGRAVPAVEIYRRRQG